MSQRRWCAPLRGAHPRYRGRRLSRAFAVLAFLAGITAGQFAAQSPAAAADCSTTAHCYATASWSVTSPSGFRGAKVMLRTNCMTTPNIGSNIVANTLWVAKGNEWMEAGITIGSFTEDGETDILYNPSRYLAMMKNGIYAEHYRGLYTPTTGMWSTIYAGADGTNDWQMWFDNVQNHDVSYNHFTEPATRLTTGTELTNDGAHTYGSSSRMYFYNLSGTLTPNWQGATSGAVIALAQGGMNATWASYAWWMRDGRGPTC